MALNWKCQVQRYTSRHGATWKWTYAILQAQKLGYLIYIFLKIHEYLLYVTNIFLWLQYVIIFQYISFQY